MFMVSKTTNPNSESGFALLMSLIVVGVLLSIGLTYLDLSTSQVQLSTNSRDSERSFHAANAGMECGRYWRRVSSDLMETGQDIVPDCFDAAATPTISPTTLGTAEGLVGDGVAYVYSYEFTWGTNNDRCSQITSLVMVANDPSTQTLELTGVATQVPGYTGADPKICVPGERCTILSSRGYNQDCSNTTNFGTIQREVLLEF
jgi:Tfp pilus assembly protein PilX